MSMKINKKIFSFCLITDKKYLAQTTILLDQLKDYNVYILCIDTESYNFIFLNYPNNCEILKLDTLEKFFNLKKIKYSRSYLEYIFTLKSFFIKWIFKKIKNNYYAIYLDSDILFFSEPALLIRDINTHSVCLTPHSFSKNNYHFNIYGKFNAGFISFKNDKYGLKVLNFWAKNCEKECSYTNIQNFSDQMYLNILYKNFCKVKKINNAGVNLAPWNLDSFKININKKNQILVDGKRVVFFHFHGFKNIFGLIYSLGLKDYKVKKNRKIINYIYKKYLNLLNKKFQNYKELKSYHYNYNLIKLIKNSIKCNLLINI